jgi:hypothetical protein
VGADVGAEGDHVALEEPELTGIVGVDEDVVAVGAGDRVVVAEHHRVELLAPAGGHREMALGDLDGGPLGDGEPPPARRGGRHAAPIAFDSDHCHQTQPAKTAPTPTDELL